MWLGIGVKIVNWWRRAANGPFSNHATLTNGLVSYWKLDETSGVRYDSVTASANDLTDNNTVGVSLAGPSGTVASFVDANDESFYRTALSGRTGVTYYCGWVKGNFNSNSGILGHNTGNNGPLSLYGYDNALWMKANASGQVDLSVAAVSNVWNFVQVYFNPGVEFGLSINNGAFTTTATAQTALTESGEVFRIGAYYDHTYCWDGQIARVGYWNAIPDATERTSIFNSGNGKSYADLTAAEKVGLVSYWNLDEVSGVRYDSVVASANDLTDNNTVNCDSTGVTGIVQSGTGSIAGKTGLTTFDATSGDCSVGGWFYMPSGYNSGSGIQPFRLYQSSGGFYRKIELVQAAFSNTVYAAATGTDGSSSSSSFSTAGAAAGWHLWIGVYDSSARKTTLWFDGVAQTQGNALTAATPADTSIVELGVATSSQVVKQAPIGYWTKQLSPTEIATLFNSGRNLRYAQLTGTLTTGLTHWYELSELTGNFADTVGGGTFTLTRTSGTTAAISAGGAMRNAAARFVLASNESLTVPNFVFGNEFTVSLWANKTSTPTTYEAFISCIGSWPNNVQFAMYINGANGSLLVGDGASYSNPGITDTWGYGWTHWLVVFGADKIVRCFRNNVDVTAGPTALSGTPYRTPQTLYIGSGSTVISAFDGLIDEAAIWSRALTAQERTDLYNAGAGLFY